MPSCSYVTSSRWRKPWTSIQASRSAWATWLPLSTNMVLCIAAENPVASSQAVGFGCRLWLGRVGLGAAQPGSKIASRDVVCEVAVEVGGARSSSEADGPVGVGDRVRVKGSLKVYHVAKLPNLDLDGLEGAVKEVLGIWKGKQVSANLPYKVQFELEVDGKRLKFLVHLKEGEFEVVEAAAR
eukprot:TRINITY_DN26962_c0_g1_i1.p1 TRINITY_DN26962_c0_g1~~TRINITY_DN26962_c0_g1_i1.p1  ORF type:complete len:199 (-),score=18.46 TRINITY_DN26962_c0_g1_i1:327-875(-)